jgi:putative addiction module killer protein
VYVIKTLPEFDAWLRSLSDKTAQRRLVARLRKASLGNLGDVKPVGKGVVEMREHFGPGWRMYYTLRGDQLVVMLGGGAKSSQRTDIALPQRRAAMIEEE